MSRSGTTPATRSHLVERRQLMDMYEGWAADPFEAHELRYFVDGLPTKLVRDGLVEGFDDLPPKTTWPAPLVLSPEPPGYRSFEPEPVPAEPIGAETIGAEPIGAESMTAGAIDSQPMAP